MYRTEYTANLALAQSVRTPPAFPMMKPSDFAIERARKALARKRMRATLHAALGMAALVCTGLSFV